MTDAHLTVLHGCRVGYENLSITAVLSSWSMEIFPRGTDASQAGEAFLHFNEGTSKEIAQPKIHSLYYVGRGEKSLLSNWARFMEK